MQRPPHLPDFDEPPLNEVVLGVQFAPLTPFNSVYLREIWDLYRDKYPKVQEFASLPPHFEIFGGQEILPPFRVQFGGAPPGSRIWFVAEEENRLLQFQPDRFLANWRKNSDQHHYPRFEAIAETYRIDLDKLAAYLHERFRHVMDINQAELTYINIIEVDDFSEISNWLNLLNNVSIDVEGLVVDLREIIKNGEDRPFARFYHSVQAVRSLDGGRKAINLSLSVRGKPESRDINSAMMFLQMAREAIVTRFDKITTENAHTHWGKKK